MENGFLTPDKCLTIERGKHGRRSLIVADSNNQNIILGKYIINETAEEIIKYFGQEIRVGDIIASLSKKYKSDEKTIRKQILNFLNLLRSQFDINVKIEKEFKGCTIQSKYADTIYPHGAIIEITNNCNFKCIHCYGGFCASKEYMKYQDFTNIIDQLEALKFESIELTGGEITTHPDFCNMLEYALGKNISKISLITNGSLLTDEILEMIEKNRERIIIQLDLHGMDDEYLEWFMGVKHYSEKNMRLIKKISNIAKYFRVATVVTRRNLSQLEEIADWIYGNNIKNFGVSLVIPNGRALECGEKDLFLNQKEILSFKKILERIDNKYPNFISVVDDYNDKLNCGCITNCISIKVDGNLKMCAMDSGDTLSISLGNILHKSLVDIYKENHLFVEQIAALEAPGVNHSSCKECENLSYCAKCLHRAFTFIKNNPNKCQWATNLPEDIMSRL